MSPIADIQRELKGRAHSQPSERRGETYESDSDEEMGGQRVQCAQQ